MSGGSLTPTELQRASRQWDEACQTLPEEWQLIEVRLRHERAPSCPDQQQGGASTRGDREGPSRRAASK